MVAPATPRVGPIKLKLNLGGKGPVSTPSTPAPAPKAGSPKRGSRKTKVKDDQDWEENDNTGENVNGSGISPESSTTANGKRKAGKSSKASIAVSTPVTVKQETQLEEEADAEEDDQQMQAGPSRLRSRSHSNAPQTLPLLIGHKIDPDAIQKEQSFASPQHPQTPTPATTKPRARPSSSKRVAKFTPKSRLNRSKPKARPSAIPSHLIPETGTPSRSTASLPETPAPYDPSSRVDSSEATSPDPLSLPLSPSAYGGDVNYTPNGDAYDDTPTTGRGRTGGRWMRIKRPLKELLNRIMTEIRKKDDYALFEEPVDLEAFPDYLTVIGGEDKMMDMGTMQSKVDNGEYRSIEQIETDLKTLVTAAQTYNPPGTIPYNSASRILTIGMKHVDRSRPLVLTPSPSPTRNSATPFRGGSVFSVREGTAAPEDAGRVIEDLHPSSYVPEQMLEFPPNSLQALAVGWNLNGGKRVHPKRVVRSREKFVGKWRHWDLDGTRDLAEMDEVVNLTDNWRETQGDELRKILDWKSLRKGRGAWWESDTALAGPSTIAGQVPTPYAPYVPRRDKVTRRELGPLEWGLYPEIDAEVAFLRKRSGAKNATDTEILSEHIRPAYPRPKKSMPPPPPNLVNIYDTGTHIRDAGDWVRDMCTGDTRGEAYLTSVDRFIQGAMKTVGSTTFAGVKVEVNSPKREKPDAQSDQIPLDEFAFKHYHNGLLSSGARQVASDILQTLTTPGDKTQWLSDSARQAYGRLAMRELTSPANPMDIKPLLRQESDFLHQGVGGRSVKDGLDWAGGELARLDEWLRSKIARDATEAERYRALVQQEGVATKRKRDDDGVEDTGVDGDVDMESDKRKKVKLEGSESKLSMNQNGGSSPLSSAAGSPKQPQKTVAAAGAAPRTEPEPFANPALAAAPASGPSTAESMNAYYSKPISERRYNKGVDLYTDAASMTKLRLELVALSKFYPLPALKRMSKADAAKLLPVNVRALMVGPGPETKDKEKDKDQPQAQVQGGGKRK